MKITRVSKYGKPDPNVRYTTLKGVASEERFLRVCTQYLEHGRFPDWVVSFSRGTREDDSNQIDAWAHTSEGFRIAIQVKSQKGHAEKFRARAKEQNRHIIGVAAGPKVTDEEIFTATNNGLVETRQQLLLGEWQ